MAKAKTRKSVTGPNGETVQLEFMPCGVRRCDRCWEGEKPKGASLEDLKKTRKRRSNPEGHGPYFRVYRRVGERFVGRTIRRDEEAALADEVGEEIFEIQPKRWASWRGQKSRDEQNARSGTRRGPQKGRPRNDSRTSKPETAENDDALRGDLRGDLEEAVEPVA